MRKHRHEIIFAAKHKNGIKKFTGGTPKTLQIAEGKEVLGVFFNSGKSGDFVAYATPEAFGSNQLSALVVAWRYAETGKGGLEAVLATCGKPGLN